jgi:hypothetical protein
MTRYLCVHPDHETDGTLRPVDVTAQVRLERAFVPRSSGYLASTEDVLRKVAALDIFDPTERPAAIRRLLTGTSTPIDAPVVLVSESRVRAMPGLYELDELRTREPALDRLVRRSGEPNLAEDSQEELVLLGDSLGDSDFQSTDDPATIPLAPSAAGLGVQARPAQRSRVIPQGVFPLDELAWRLAAAPTDEASLADAIRTTPAYGTMRSGEHRAPWRVVVECPVAAGDPPSVHEMVFTGTGDPEPATVLGVPAGGLDVVLERASETDLEPPMSVARAERRLKVTLAVELAIAALLLALAWASGGLGLAAREAPGWLGFAFTLAAAAVAVGAFGLYAPSDAEGNPNDTLVLRRFYDSRIELLWWSAILSAALFAGAVVSAVVPPILASDHVVPAPAISFDATNRPVTARVQMTTDGVSTNDVLVVEIRQFAAGDSIGTLAGVVTVSGDQTGRIVLDDTVTLDRGAGYLAVQAAFEGDPLPTCTPGAAAGAGCTIVTVPPLGAGSAVGASPSAIVVTPPVVTSPSPVVSSSPSASASPTFSSTSPVP